MTYKNHDNQALFIAVLTGLIIILSIVWYLGISPIDLLNYVLYLV